MNEGSTGVIVENGARELAETQPKTSLSMTGSQLRGLALTSVAGFEYTTYLSRSPRSKLTSFIKRFPGQSDQAKITQKETKIKQAIEAGDVESATQLAQFLKVPGKQTVPELETALTSDLSVEDVVGKMLDHEFLKSLPFLRHTGTPKEGGIILPDLGVYATTDPGSNTLSIKINTISPWPPFDVILPLDQQKLAWIDYETIEGTREEALRSQFEVFGALARITDTVYTHKTGSINMIEILNSGSFKQSKLLGSSLEGKKGLMTEKITLDDVSYFDNALSQIDQGKNPSLPYKDREGAPNFIKAGYSRAGRADEPIFLFDHTLPARREVNQEGAYTQIIGETRFDDPSLIGIWVTPTLRKNLLDWIDTWPDEKKQASFKGRTLESLLISSSENLPERYRKPQA